LTINTSGNSALVNLAGEVGVIERGRLADIAIRDNDPIADITVLQWPSEISIVVKDGRIIDHEADGFHELAQEPPRARTFVQS
jgi:imidazolonepropionase-like amidohydrolase